MFNPVRRKSAAAPSVGLVGDHADKLSRIRPFVADDDERPTREDREYGRTILLLPPLPRSLSGKGKQ